MAWIERTNGEHWRVRYRSNDSVRSEGGFTSPTAAENRAHEIEVDRRRHTFRDPVLARTTLDDWLARWWPTLAVDDLTIENCTYLTRKHISPRFGHNPLGGIHSSNIQQWAADLHACGYQHTTVHGLLSLLGRILGEAVDDNLIPANPVHHHRNRGRRAHHIIREMFVYDVAGLKVDVTVLADNAADAAPVGPSGALCVFRVLTVHPDRSEWTIRPPR